MCTNLGGTQYHQPLHEAGTDHACQITDGRNKRVIYLLRLANTVDSLLHLSEQIHNTISDAIGLDVHSRIVARSVDSTARRSAETDIHTAQVQIHRRRSSRRFRWRFVNRRRELSSRRAYHLKVTTKNQGSNFIALGVNSRRRVVDTGAS